MLASFVCSEIIAVKYNSFSKNQLIPHLVASGSLRDGRSP